MTHSTTHSVRTQIDPREEVRRAGWPDVVVGGRRLNRLTAHVSVDAAPEPADAAAVKAEWERTLLPSTLEGKSPVVALDWPAHGPFVLSPHGTYFDTYLGVGQKVLDSHHPAFREMTERLLESDLLLRREIVTDDYVSLPGDTGLVTAADLAALWADAVSARWSNPDGYKVFLSSSGAEAVEAALKLCYEVAYKRFLERHGVEVFREVQAALGFETVPYFQRETALEGHPVYRDYPFQVIACEGAFHGRTLGALSLTWSKKAHQLGYPKPWNVHHVPYNAPGDPVRDRIDFRGIREILAVPGELVRVVRERRRIPKDLFAGFVAEPFQGEGGYLPGDAAFFRKARAACDEAGALLVADEVQSVARTGRLFMTEHLGIAPDVVCTAKSMVVGVTVARAELARYCHVGWHSNTWGGGRLFDVNFAHTTLHTLLEHRDPAFGGLGYLENEEVKGERFRAGLERLRAKHPRLVEGFRGVGLMNAILVRRRADVIATAWRKGLKLLGCGWPGEVAPIRILLLADTLSREVDELLRVLDVVLSELA